MVTESILKSNTKRNKRVKVYGSNFIKYVQRKKIPDILNRIIMYRFEPYYAPSSECSQFNGASSLHEAVKPVILILV